MGRPVCAATECERSVVRYRDGAGYCLFHPDAQPPVIDPQTGRPVVEKPLRASKAAKPKPVVDPPAAPYRAPGRVVERSAPSKPTPGEVAAAYDSAAEQAARIALPSDGPCPQEGCGRPARHRGRHAQPKPHRPPRPARPPRPIEQRPADGRCTTAGCLRPWKHKGPHSKPLDVDEAVRRYTGGEGLFDLAADLHVAHKRLRQLLVDAGVRIRGRGEVIGTRGPEPRPIDVDECTRLYATGMTARAIAEQLGVKARRVYDVLRAQGVLGPPGGREPGPGSLNAVRLKLTPDETAAVRGRAAALGLSMNQYLRGLVLPPTNRPLTARRRRR
jgi:hypothetical protein